MQHSESLTESYTKIFDPNLTTKNRISKCPATSQQTDQVVKVILIGASCSGKSSLYERYLTGKFNEKQQATIGASFQAKLLTLDNHKQVKLHLYDTCGLERFNSITQQYFRGAKGCIAVFDLSQRQSLDALEVAISEYKTYAEPAFRDNVVIVANKADLERALSEHDCLQFAEA